MGTAATAMLACLFRVFRVITMLVVVFSFCHFTQAAANSYTTPLYIKMATDPRTKAQYARPLHDIMFTSDRSVACAPWMQTAYDVALWLSGGNAIRLAGSRLLKDGSVSTFESCCLAVIFHNIFMAIVQVSTLMPASGGLAESWSTIRMGLITGHGMA